VPHLRSQPILARRPHGLEVLGSQDRVQAGRLHYPRCWPAGVPGFTVYTRVEPIYFLQTPKEVVIVNELNAQLRHI
jgi:hypothetical protein